jgi:hypothetical protein
MLPPKSSSDTILQDRDIRSFLLRFSLLSPMETTVRLCEFLGYCFLGPDPSRVVNNATHASKWHWSLQKKKANELTKI